MANQNALIAQPKGWRIEWYEPTHGHQSRYIDDERDLKDTIAHHERAGNMYTVRPVY